MPPELTATWIVRNAPNEAAALRLFCLPYSGGSASVFRQWQRLLSIPELEVCAIQLPGREQRFQERPFFHMHELIPALGEAILPLLDRPFVLFGHSLGALIAFCLSRWLRSEQRRLPRLLMVSGRAAPQVGLRRPPVHHLPDTAFIQELAYYGATPKAVLDDPELRELFLPMLRADFSLFETYTHKEEPPLPCPIVACTGESDHAVLRADVESWRVHTASTFTLHTFDGGHFFLNTASAALLQILAGELRALLAAPSSP